MTPWVYINGVCLNRLATVADVQDSTICRVDGWSGDYQLDFTWAAPPRFAASWFVRGAVVEVCRGGVLEWSGFLAEPETGDVWTLHANGRGSRGDEFDAIAYDSTFQTYSGSTVPDVVADNIESRGCGFSRRGVSLGTDPVATVDGASPISAAEVFRLAAVAQGKRWFVSTDATLSLFSDDTTPSWVMTPGGGYMGTADDQYVSHMWGYYVSSVDSTTGKPNGWAYVLVGDDAAGAKFGRREVVVDLTALGLLAPLTATNTLQGRFNLVGGRMGWTNGVTLTTTNMRHAVTGYPDPMGVRAGQMLRIPGVTDMRSSATYLTNVDVVLGSVKRIHAEQRAEVTPIGLVPRDFQGPLAAAQPPTTTVVAA